MNYVYGYIYISKRMLVFATANKSIPFFLEV